jgi:hypothetical protein
VPDKSGYRTTAVPGLHFSGNGVNQACGVLQSAPPYLQPETVTPASCDFLLNVRKRRLSALTKLCVQTGI